MISLDKLKKGLFKINEDILTNSDQNGIFNILCKYLKDKYSFISIKQARNNGFVDNPSRLRVFQLFKRGLTKKSCKVT